MLMAMVLLLSTKGAMTALSLSAAWLTCRRRLPSSEFSDSRDSAISSRLDNLAVQRRVRMSSLFLDRGRQSRPNGDQPPTPLPAGECVPPLFGSGRDTPAGEGVGGPNSDEKKGGGGKGVKGPNSDDGKDTWDSRYICTLCRGVSPSSDPSFKGTVQRDGSGRN